MKKDRIKYYNKYKMKTVEIFIPCLNTDVRFYIGENRHDNFDVIDMGSGNDLWFHAKKVSSCHVLAELPDIHINKKAHIEIVKYGCQLCKQHTSKLNALNNVEFIYTEVQNVKKTKTPGMVTHTDSMTYIF